MANIQVPVVKAKRAVAIDTDALPMEVFAEAVLLGCKELVNRGMSKITVASLEGDELDAARNSAFAKAEENLAAMLQGEIRFSSGVSKKAEKIPAEIKTEALRIAKAAITQQIKDGGEKPSLYAKSDITKWAKELLDNDESYFEMAKAAIEQRKATPLKISLAALKPSAKLVKAAEEKKAKAASAKKDKPISAKQAGMPAPRQKPKPSAHATH